MGLPRVEHWGPERVGELAALADAALPGEALTSDELLAACWDDPDAAVLGPSDDSGAVAVVDRQWGENRVAFLVLLAVAPVAQGSGGGRALLDAAVAWAAERGCRELYAGGSAPFYLWPGVDTRWTRALCLLESAGFDRLGAEVNMSCPSTFRRPPPPGVRIDRVVEDDDAEAVRAFCARHWGWWVPETSRGIEQGGCFAARAESDGAVVGFVCHSVSRGGWLGPMGTDPERQRGGVGAALVGAVCADVAAGGRPDVEIAWVGPVGFYARSAGASVSRVFLRMRSRIGR